MNKNFIYILLFFSISLSAQINTSTSIYFYNDTVGITQEFYKLDFLLSRDGASTRLNSIIIGNIGDTINTNDNTTLVKFTSISPINDTITILIDTVGTSYRYLNAMQIIEGVDTVKIDFDNTYTETGWFTYTSTTDTLDVGIAKVVLKDNWTGFGTSGYIPNVYPNNVSSTYVYSQFNPNAIEVKIFNFQ